MQRSRADTASVPLQTHWPVTSDASSQRRRPVAARSRAMFVVRLGLIVGVLAAVPSCVSEPGLPWGTLAARVALRFDPPASRLTEAGALKTANDERVQNLEISARVAEVLVRTTPTDADTSVFDPANPPEGYSLCHNGHCHAADGSLPTYEEIAAQLGTSQSTGPTVRWLAVDGTSIPASAAGADLPLAGCGELCDVGLGRATLLEVHLTDLHVSGAASGIDGPIGGLDFSLPGELVITKVIDVPFDQSHAPIVSLAAVVRLPATLLDDVPLADHASGAAVQLPDAITQAVLARVREDVKVDVQTARTWP